MPVYNASPMSPLHRLLTYFSRYKRPLALGFLCASLVALAEMRRDYRIVTFDSDFSFYRMAGRLSFAIINNGCA